MKREKGRGEQEGQIQGGWSRDRLCGWCEEIYVYITERRVGGGQKKANGESERDDERERYTTAEKEPDVYIERDKES